MKKFIWILLISLLLSSCSINNDTKTTQIKDFNIEEKSENFDLNFEENGTDKVDTELAITKIPKKFARFTDYDIGFSFLYPDNDKITQDKLNYTIMIKNYDPIKKNLQYGDFDIKISYFDNNSNCDNFINNISSIYELSGITIRRGQGSKIHNSTEQLLCFQKEGKIIVLSYIEIGDFYVNTIFNSLQFN